MKTKQHKESAFTLIELLMAMILVSLISVACIWIFKQSLDISSKAKGRAELNKKFRITQDKLRKDLLGTLPLKSGLQNFVMISRYRYVEAFDKTFQQDYLSFATSTRVTSDLTTGYVSYDIVLEDDVSVLYRYVSTMDDYVNNTTKTLRREEVVRGCVQFKVEYLWADPRVEPASGALVSNEPFEKNILNPGAFFVLHPYVNEADTGRNYFTRYNTGGLNGSNILEHADGVLHAGATATSSMGEFVKSSRYGTGVVAHGVDAGYILIPDPEDITLTKEQKVIDVPSYEEAIPADSEDPTVGEPGGACNLLWVNPYLRVIHIRSPNLYKNGAKQQYLTASTIPYDITGLYPTDDDWVDAAIVTSDAIAHNDLVDPTAADYMNRNAAARYPTYIPAQVKVTVKLHNEDMTVTRTQTFRYTLPQTGP